MSRYIKLCLIAISITQLSGCVVAAVGAGAAGALYVDHHYNISIDKKQANSKAQFKQATVTPQSKGPTNQSSKK